ncbi:MAG: HprK-related kinase A [Magnetospiraceae bacterium]
MILGDLTDEQCRGALRGAGLTLRTGPFLLRVRSAMPAIQRGLRLLYDAVEASTDQGYADFHVAVNRPHGPRRWYKPQALFFHDEDQPFYPLPSDQAMPMLEWGLNWCISSHAHHFLVIHAAALERNDRVLLMPADSGHGKSTLTAALVHSGWRLLSDELALIDPNTGLVHPLARPINLKNQSIDVIRTTFSSAVLTDPVADTHKGTVALMRPPTDSVQRADTPAAPRWIVVPLYDSAASLDFSPRARSETFMSLAKGGFNYSLLGALGFETLVNAVDRSACYSLVYSDLDAALRLFEDLAFDRLPTV